MKLMDSGGSGLHNGGMPCSTNDSTVFGGSNYSLLN